MDSFSERIQMLSIQLVPFIMAVVFHEYAHGFVAYHWGDKTAQSQGRLTLNPIPHMDPLGTLIFPMINMLTGMNILFGWAKPVPILGFFGWTWNELPSSDSFGCGLLLYPIVDARFFLSLRATDSNVRRFCLAQLCSGDI